MSIRATIKVVRASADTEYVSLYSDINNVSAEAIAFPNPSSKNKWFTEEVALGDLRITLVSKAFYEEATLLENITTAFGVNKAEAVTLVETFVNVIDYRREFNDAFVLDDFSLINKDYTGNKGNVTFVSDLYKSSLSKNLSDGVTFTEHFDLLIEILRDYYDSFGFIDESFADVGKNLNDLIDAFTELKEVDFDKALFDSVATNSLTQLHPSLTKADAFGVGDAEYHSTNLGKNDSFGYTDSHITTFFKVISDAFALDDSALINKDFTGDKGNVAFVTDIFERSTQYQRLFADSFGFSDENTIDTGLDKSEILNLTDELDKVTSHSKADDYVLLDKPQLDNTLSKFDSYSISDEHTTDSGLVKNDSYNLNDTNDKNTSLGKADSFPVSDAQLVSLSKKIFDYFALDDAALIDKDFTGTKGNVFGVTDIFIAVIEFKRTVADSFSFTDNYTRELNLNKSDSATLIELLAKDWAKGIDDSFGFTEVVDTHPNLGKGDSVSFTETNKLDSSKGISDSATLSELIDASAGKYFGHNFAMQDVFKNVVSFNISPSDSFTLDDGALIDKDYVGNKGNILGFTDVLAQVIGKIKADNIPLSDLIGLASSVSKSDALGISDASIISSGINPSDSISFSENLKNVINKVLNDNFTLDDGALIDKDYVGNKGNVLSLTEVIVLAVVFDREFADSTTLSDSIATTYNKPLNETLSFSEITAKGNNKPFSDSVSFSEVFNKAVTYKRSFTDAFVLDDGVLVDKDYTGNKGNIFNLTDILSFSTQYQRGVGESLTLNEVIGVSSSKPFGESLTLNESFGLQLVKTISDGFGLEDTGLIGKDYFANKDNVVGATDNAVIENITIIGGNVLNSGTLNSTVLN